MAEVVANAGPVEQEQQPVQVRLSQAKDQRIRTASDAAEPYRIGEVGTPWGDAEKAEWLAQTTLQRSYSEEVLSKMDALDSEAFEVREYGALSIDAERYPLKAVLSRNWDDAKPCVLVTGGVHGYEKSGVQGALLFLKTRAKEYMERFNVVVCACVSPWGYEHIERWNPKCLDPNRSFGPDAATHTEESAAVIALLASLGLVDRNADSSEAGSGCRFVCHVDCHETTNTDESEFMPARAALQGAVYKPCDIPDGFYLVGDSVKPVEAFHTAVIASVREVTHIAPGDEDGTLLEEPLLQDGCIAVPAATLGLCSSVTGAPYCTTTEVYPDSPRPECTDDQCNLAQVASVVGALDYIISAQGTI